MRVQWILVIIGFPFYIATASAISAPAESLLNADRALAARSHADGFVAAYTVAMAEDARKLDSDAPAALGRDAILALMARYPADLKLDWKPEEAVVASSGEMGFTWGHFTATFHDKKGQTVTSYGKYLDVWRRQGDGTWRWIADIGTGDPPPV
jgi:ketosteroid isomerase-like protein